MCIDYRKLNKATRKDHYPLPFIDQMLERLSKNTHFFYLDGYSGFSQIHVNTADQEKTTFTCPYGTYAYRRIILVYAMPLILFRGVCLLSFRVFARTISPFMEPPLTAISKILIKFCRHERRRTWFLIWRRDTS